MSYNANIIIKNNTMDQGRYSDGTTPTTYNYAHCSWIYGSALIEGNSFMNPAASADMLNITDGSCTIRNNKFIRNSTSINSYIKHRYVSPSYSGINQITDNIFDQSTTNGTNEELVIGLNPGSIYTRNKNQTGIIYIPIYDNTLGTYFLGNQLDQFSVAGTGIGFTMVKSGTNNLITDFKESQISVTFPALFFARRSFHLGDYLEKGMCVTGLRLGGYRSSGNLTDFTSPVSSFGVRLKSHNGVTNMDAKTYASTTTSYFFEYVYEIDTPTKFSNLSVDTQYTLSGGSGSAGPDGDFFGFVQPDLLRAGNGYQMEVEFFANITWATNTWSIFFSPIEVKYIW